MFFVEWNAYEKYFTGVPVNWMFLAPAVSPKRTTSFPNNPGIRLYKFNTNTGKVIDYMQLYLDLKVKLKLISLSKIKWFKIKFKLPRLLI